MGTAKNPLFNCRDVQPFEGVCTWLHDALNVPREEQFDEVVANVYSREKDQYIGPHTDQNALLGETNEIISMSMGAAGVFYWQPHPEGRLKGWYSKQEGRHAQERSDGKWGCTPLLPGELILVNGTFQRHFLHGTLRFSEAARVDEVLRRFKVCSDSKKVFESTMYQDYFDEKLVLLDRSVVTLRRIVNHKTGCPELVNNQKRDADTVSSPRPVEQRVSTLGCSGGCWGHGTARTTSA